MWSRPQVADDSGLLDFYPDRVSSAVFAGLRTLHPSKAVTSNAVPKAAGQFAPSVRLRCKRRGHLPLRRQDLPGALLVLAPGTAPASASRAVAGVAPSALRGLVFQSPNTIYQSDPFCPSLRQQRPSEAKRACFSVPGQNTGRPLCYAGKRARLPLANARCLWPSTERALRLFRGAAGFALQRPPTGPLRAGRPPQRVPRAGSQAPRQQSCHVACLPEDGMR